MAQKRRARKRRKPKPFGKTPPDKLLAQARRFLDSKDARSALERLKQLPEGGAYSAQKSILFFSALNQRARELADSGQAGQAASMRARAVQHRESVSIGALGEEDLLRFLRNLDTSEAIATYAAYAKTGPKIARAERMLADRLIVRQCWDSLQYLDASHALRQDADLVMCHIEAMDAGDWKRAADGLRGLNRRSPYAAWRIFCTAMACFGAGDDDGLRRVLALMPDDFVLSDTVSELRYACGAGSKGGPARVQWTLGTERAKILRLGEELRKAFLDRAHPRVIERIITRLANAVSPDDPLPALVDLVQIAGLAADRFLLEMYDVVDLAKRLLPPKRVAGLLARIRLNFQEYGSDRWNPDVATVLLRHLSTEFPAADDQPLARGRILEAVAQKGKRSGYSAYLPPSMESKLTSLLNGRNAGKETTLADVMEASLDADPANREGYRFLLELLRQRRESKDRQRRILHAMATQFPDDAEPWLDLTTLHFSRNAYRQAEKTLTEARRLAPHDERIVDLQAAGFLKSSDQSRKNGHFEIATRYLGLAEALDRPGLRDILMAKRLLLNIVSSGRDPAEVAAAYLDELPLAGQIRTLALLLNEFDANHNIRNVTAEMRDAAHELLALKAPMIEELDAGEAASLVAPLPGDLGIFYSDLHIAPFLSDWLGMILDRQDDESLPNVLDILMECKMWDSVRAEISHRLAGGESDKRDPLLLLYLAVIRYEVGDDFDTRRIVDAVESAPASDRERLQAGAARLAPHATGTLREALHTFDFSCLDYPLPEFDPDEPLPPLPQEIPGEEHDLDPEPPEDWTELDQLTRNEASLIMLLSVLHEGLGAGLPWEPRQASPFDDEAQQELNALELLIDQTKLRDKRTSTLRKVAEILREVPEIRKNLDQTARKCEEADLRAEMSREARIFLFPPRIRAPTAPEFLRNFAMLAHYQTLGLSPSASAQDVRQRYLALIRAHPPSREPEYGQKIVAAYDALKDDRARIETALFGLARHGDFELALNELVQARPQRRLSPGLKTLIAAEGTADE